MANCECDQKLESMRADLTSTFDLIGPADYYDQRHQIKKKRHLISHYSDLFYYVEYTCVVYCS